MRAIATAALIAFTAITASTQTSTSGTTTTVPKKIPAKTPAAASTLHRPIAHIPKAPMPADPKATEGIAAVGTMPAATGAPASLYALRFIDLKVGDGDAAISSRPGKVMFYTVHYTGWLTDGTKFDSSVDRGEPITFPIGVHGVISGWDTGFEGMRVGGKRRLIVPYQLAYGEAGHPPVIPEKSDLIFDVELISQSDTPPQRAEAPQRPATAPGTNPVNKPAEKPEEHPE